MINLIGEQIKRHSADLSQGSSACRPGAPPVACSRLGQPAPASCERFRPIRAAQGQGAPSTIPRRRRQATVTSRSSLQPAGESLGRERWQAAEKPGFSGSWAREDSAGRTVSPRTVSPSHQICGWDTPILFCLFAAQAKPRQASFPQSQCNWQLDRTQRAPEKANANAKAALASLFPPPSFVLFIPVSLPAQPTLFLLSLLFVTRNREARHFSLSLYHLNSSWAPLSVFIRATASLLIYFYFSLSFSAIHRLLVLGLL